jgi:hypothetical protein
VSKRKKPKVKKPRVVWERKPQTQVVPNKKAYKREKKDWRNEN